MFHIPQFGWSFFYNENTVFKVWLGLDRKPLGRKIFSTLKNKIRAPAPRLSSS